MIYEYHKLDDAQDADFGVENILAVQLVGDKLHKLLNDRNSVSGALLKPLMLRQLRKSQQMKEETAHYDRALLGTYNNSYDYLCRRLVRRTELNRQQQFRDNILAHLQMGR